MVDTNCDPDLIQFVIPGNDDAIRSGEIMTRIMSDAVVEGRFIRSRRAPMADAAPAERTPEEEARIAREQALAQAAAAEAAAAREARVAQNIEAATQAGDDEPDEEAAAALPSDEAPVAEEVPAEAEAPAEEAASDAAPEAEAPASDETA